MRAVLVVLALSVIQVQGQERSATLRIHVEHEGEPVASASVVVNGTSHTSDVSGNVIAQIAAGPVEILVMKDGFAQVASTLVLSPGQEQEVRVELTESF